MSQTQIQNFQPVEDSKRHFKHFFIANARERRVSKRTVKEDNLNFFCKSG